MEPLRPAQEGIRGAEIMVIPEIASDAPMIPPLIVPYDIPQPIKERVVPVPESDLSHLISRIESIGEIGIVTNLLAGAAVAVTITAFATAQTFPPENQKYLLFNIVGIAGFVITLICCFFVYRLNECNNAHKKDILEHMRILKRRYIRDENELESH